MAGALERLRDRHAAAVLPCLTLLAVDDATPLESVLPEMERRRFEPPFWLDRATFERSLLREQLGLRQDGLWLLVDADGALRAWSFRLAPLVPQIDALLAAPASPAPKPKKRRAI